MADRRQKIVGGEEACRFDSLLGKIKPQRIEYGLVVVDHSNVNGGHVCDVFPVGRVNRIVAPSALDVSQIWPPCPSMIDRHNGNPTPRPSVLVEESGRKVCSRSPGENPGPLSATRTSTKSSLAFLASITMEPR